MLPSTQTAKFFKRVKVPVTVKQRVVMLDAKRGDQYINRTSYCDALFAQTAVVLCCCKHGLIAASRLDAECLHQQASLPVIALMPESAKYLEQHQVRHDQPDLTVTEKMVEQLRSGLVRVIEEVDPDA